MNKKITIVAAITIAILGGVYVYMEKDAEEVIGVTVGVIAGTTGEYAFVGQNLVNGLLVAEEEWNRTHPDMQVRTIIEDDGFSAVKGLSAYKKLIDFDRVDALANMTSVTIDAIYDDVVRTGIPVVQTGEQGIDPKDDNVFQVLEGNVATETALGAYAKEKGYTNLAVFVSNNATFERFYNGFASGYEGQHEVYRINPNDSSLQTEVLKALALKPDAVAILMMPSDGAIVAREVNTFAAETPLLFDGNAFTGWSDYEKVLGDTKVLNNDSIIIIKQAETNSTFVEEYKAKFGEEPGVGSTWGYETLMFLLGTMPADTDDKAAWVQNMRTKQVEGLGGKAVMFDEVGVRLPEYFIGTITDGKLPIR